MAKSSAASNLSELAHQVGIITLDQLRECWDELGSRNTPPEQLLRLLQRRNYLTPFQIDKLKKGDTTGYFYGGSKVLYKIASGGFARVYRGINVQTGEPAAIKVLRQRWTSDKESVDAFYQEGRVGMALRHPNIVRIDEVAGTDSVHYISMEFIEGGNLRDFLAIRGGRLERDEAIRLMLDALQGIAYAFDQGVTHRDIKLTNLLASSQGILKVVDFGLAALHKDERRAEEAHGQRTVEYALLEKTTGAQKGDPRSDIFFLGCVFYQMITGMSPIFEKKDRVARLLRTRLDNIRSVLEAYPAADRQLAKIIDRMMALKAQERYQTPHEVIDIVQVAALQAPIPAVARPANGVAQPSSATQLATRSVLLLESDVSLQTTIREKLHAIGYRVILTADPRRALDRFSEQPADCVIVDCETTSKAGIDAFIDIEQIAKNRKLAWSGIIMLTPQQHEWSERLTGMENLVVLVKPVTMRQLRDHVQRMVPARVEG